MSAATMAYLASLLLALVTFALLVLWLRERIVNRRLQKEVKEAFDKGRIQGIADTILANNLVIRHN